MPPLAEIGPATSLLEEVASSITAGMVVIGFAALAASYVLGRTRREVEERALRDAAWGGSVATGLLAVDVLMRYFV